MSTKLSSSGWKSYGECVIEALVFAAQRKVFTTPLLAEANKRRNTKQFTKKKSRCQRGGVRGVANQNATTERTNQETERCSKDEAAALRKNHVVGPRPSPPVLGSVFSTVIQFSDVLRVVSNRKELVAWWARTTIEDTDDRARCLRGSQSQPRD